MLNKQTHNKIITIYKKKYIYIIIKKCTMWRFLMRNLSYKQAIHFIIHTNACTQQKLINGFDLCVFFNGALFIVNKFQERKIFERKRGNISNHMPDLCLTRGKVVSNKYE